MKLLTNLLSRDVFDLNTGQLALSFAGYRFDSHLLAPVVQRVDITIRWTFQ